MKRLIKLTLIALVLSACGAENEQDNYSEGSENHKEEMTASNAEQSESGDVETDNRKLIKRADVSIECPNDKKHKKILTAIDQLNGFVSHSRQEDHSGEVHVYLEVKVPAEQYSNFMNLLKEGDGKIDHINESVEDVSAYYIDLKARIDNKKEFEIAYRKLLDSAKSVSEMLEIQREIEVLRSDIESYEQQFKHLSSRINYSTFGISLTYPSDMESPEKDYSALLGLLVIGLILIGIVLYRYYRKTS